MVTLISSTVCCKVTALASSRGAVPKTSAVIARAGVGSRNHSMNAAMPAWATRLTQERSSGGIARYQGRVASIRWLAAAASCPIARSNRWTVAMRLEGTRSA